MDARAHCGSPVFLRDEDREFVVERAARVFAEEGIVCFGWAILVNHFHLLLRCPSSRGRAGRRDTATTAVRAIVCHVTSVTLAWPTHEIAATFGASSSGVTHARSRGAARLLAAGLAADELIARTRTPAAPATAAER